MWSAENAAALLRAPDDFGFGSAGPAMEVDGVTFEEAWGDRVQGTFGAVAVFYLGRATFLKNKRAAGRPQDVADIDAIS